MQNRNTLVQGQIIYKCYKWKSRYDIFQMDQCRYKSSYEEVIIGNFVFYLLIILEI